MVRDDERQIRGLLKDYVYDAGTARYGVALWHIQEAAAGDGAGPILHLQFTAAPVAPSEQMIPFAIELARDEALDPLTLRHRLDRQLSLVLGSPSVDTF